MQKDIFKKLNLILQEVLDEDLNYIEPNTILESIDEWDSLSSIRVYVAIEKYFKVKFTANEIENTKKIEDIIKLIDIKSSAV